MLILMKGRQHEKPVQFLRFLPDLMIDSTPRDADAEGVHFDSDMDQDTTFFLFLTGVFQMS